MLGMIAARPLPARLPAMVRAWRSSATPISRAALRVALAGFRRARSLAPMTPEEQLVRARSAGFARRRCLQGARSSDATGCIRRAARPARRARAPRKYRVIAAVLQALRRAGAASGSRRCSPSVADASSRCGRLPPWRRAGLAADRRARGRGRPVISASRTSRSRAGEILVLAGAASTARPASSALRFSSFSRLCASASSSRGKARFDPCLAREQPFLLLAHPGSFDGLPASRRAAVRSAAQMRQNRARQTAAWQLESRRIVKIG